MRNTLFRNHNIDHNILLKRLSRVFDLMCLDCWMFEFGDFDPPLSLHVIFFSAYCMLVACTFNSFASLQSVDTILLTSEVMVCNPCAQEKLYIFICERT